MRATRTLRCPLHRPTRIVCGAKVGKLVASWVEAFDGDDVGAGGGGRVRVGQFGQLEGLLSVSAIGGAEEGEEGLVLRDGHVLPIAERPSARCEAEAYKSDSPTKGSMRCPCRAGLRGDCEACLGEDS